MLDKFISPFIASQFPAFYRDQGSTFVAFLQAYYEWMEQEGNVINSARSLLDYMDIDQTEQQFIKHFKNTYIQSLPESIISNKQLLVKHILDLYRTKGTQRAYELLFQILFGENIDIYIPSNYIIKPSDGVWVVPQYIEVSGSSYLVQLAGNQIYSASESATAIVESVYQKVVNNKIVNVVNISSLVGRFKAGDKILCKNIPGLTISNAPYVTGSLTSVSLQTGGYGFNAGDIVNVTGGGVGGKARVVATTNQNGKVTFNLIGVGYGFSTSAVVTVLPILVLNITGSTGTFIDNDKILVSATSANGQLIFSNTSVIKLINFSTSPAFVSGDTITGSVGGSASISSITGGGGSGASFSVGGITNQIVYQVYTDYISSGYDVTLDSGSLTTNTFIITMGNNSAPFSAVGNTLYSSTNSVLLYVKNTSTTSVTTGETLSNSSLGIAGLYVYKAEPNLIWVTGTDTNLTNINIASGITLISSGTSSTVSLTNVDAKQTIIGNGQIHSITGTSPGPYTIGVGFSTGKANGYFIPSGNLINSFTGSYGNIVSISRSVNWSPLFSSGTQNLDTTIGSALSTVNIIAGTITYIANVVPGTGYSNDPYVDIIEPQVAALQLSDGSGGIVGHDASVTASAINANGIVTAVQVIDSGYGYNSSETVVLASTNTFNQTVVTGTAMIELDGIGSGYWANDRGFLSDVNYIQDSNFYQNYSYQIVAQRMISSYESLVRELVHPAGVALFGKFRVKSQFSDNQSADEQFIVYQNSGIIHSSPQNNVSALNYAVLGENTNYLLDEFNNVLVQYGLTL
jgi:hypothetical protein